MNPDLIIVAGALTVIMGIAALVSAFSDRRWPWAALVLFAWGGGVIAYAVLGNPGVYSLDRWDEPVFNVIAMILN